MERDCFNPDEVKLARAEEIRRLNFHKGPGRDLDIVTVASVGSFLGRTLRDYREILAHSGAPDIVDFARGLALPDFTLIDIGCGAGVALIQMRPLFPHARLIGIDIRDVTLNLIQELNGRRYTVSSRFVEANVEFHQGIFLDINQLVPQGYDMLISVASFYNAGDHHPPMSYSLRLFYEGLHQGGAVFIQFNPSRDQFRQVEDCLKCADIPFQFFTADKRILSIHALASQRGLLGTLMLGPKT